MGDPSTRLLIDDAVEVDSNTSSLVRNRPDADIAQNGRTFPCHRSCGSHLVTESCIYCREDSATGADVRDTRHSSPDSLLSCIADGLREVASWHGETSTCIRLYSSQLSADNGYYVN